MVLSKQDRDDIACEIAEKCDMTYKEVRKKISDRLTNYGFLIKEAAIEENLPRHEMERKNIYRYYAQFHGLKYDEK